jgi:HD-GYP domain-containing protein (c-di-GMP phosphodiesterase class II)
MLSVLGSAMEMRDPYTAEHEQAVAALAVEIAEELGLEPADRQAIREALSEAAARQELIRCAGTQFDADVVAALERVLDRD